MSVTIDTSVNNRIRAASFNQEDSHFLDPTWINVPGMEVTKVSFQRTGQKRATRGSSVGPRHHN